MTMRANRYAGTCGPALAVAPTHWSRQRAHDRSPAGGLMAAAPLAGSRQQPRWRAHGSSPAGGLTTAAPLAGSWQQPRIAPHQPATPKISHPSGSAVQPPHHRAEE